MLDLKRLKSCFWGYVNEFVLYSFAGWLYETVCESIFAKEFVLNRGYLHLPICPIYGFGAFIALWLMTAFFKNINTLKVFAGGTIITTVVEYIAALMLEALLHKSLWDYSDWICNFQGRISLISSLIFGLGCVGAYKLRPVIEAENKPWYKISGIIFLVLIIVDFFIVTFGG